MTFTILKPATSDTCSMVNEELQQATGKASIQGKRSDLTFLALLSAKMRQESCTIKFQTI